MSKKDAGLVETERPTVVSAHRDFLRRFLHDLATPLSAVSLHLEAADRRIRRGADPSESLAIARAEITRAFDLFDRGRELLLFEPSEEQALAFDELVTSVLAGSGLDVKLHGKTGGFVRADRRAFADALNAILANALETSPASAVSVAVGRDAGDLEVRVENPGRLPAGDPDSLFSPRLAGPGKSWGMGLARARLLLATAGGTVRLEQAGERVAATMRIPEARP